MFSSQTLRQMLVKTGLFFCSVSDGFIFGQMSGMMASLQTSKRQYQLTDSDISWIASAMSITSMFGFILAASLSSKLGRRRAITILSTPILFNWIILYFAERMAEFMVSRIMVGMCFGGVLMLCFISTTEYTAPATRNFWLNFITSVGPAIGMALGHILGTVLHWKKVALIGIVPAALTSLLPCFFVESPSWLASKGRFEECEIAFKKLHKDSETSKKELQLLIEVEKCKLDKKLKVSWKEFRSLTKQKYVWKIWFIVVTLIVYSVAAGKIMFTIFAISIIRDIAGHTDIVMHTLLIDSFAIIGSIISCFLIEKMNMRSLLFSVGILSNFVLFIFSLCLYFRPGNSYFPWIASVLFALYMVLINSGPCPVLESLPCELFPLELKVYFFMSFGVVLGASMFLSLKWSPFFFSSIGYHGVFFINAIIVCICQLYLWFKLPETKGRTLQEIELYFKNGTFDKIDNLLAGDIKALV